MYRNTMRLVSKRVWVLQNLPKYVKTDKHMCLLRHENHFFFLNFSRIKIASAQVKSHWLNKNHIGTKISVEKAFIGSKLPLVTYYFLSCCHLYFIYLWTFLITQSPLTLHWPIRHGHIMVGATWLHFLWCNVNAYYTKVCTKLIQW